MPKTHIHVGLDAAPYTLGRSPVNRRPTIHVNLGALRSALSLTIRTLAAFQRTLAQPRTMRNDHRRQERSRDAMRARAVMIAARKRLD